MPAQEQGFDCFSILAGTQFGISCSTRKIQSSVVVRMCLKTADLTAKRLLIGSVGTIYIMAHTAFLGGIGTLDPDRLSPTFGGIPGNLLGDMCQVGGTQIGIHGSGFVLHRGNRQLFIGKLCVRMLSKTLVDRSVDRLTHMPDQALPTSAVGGGKLGNSLLFETGPQFGLTTALLSIPLLPLSEFAMKGAVVLVRARGDEVGNPHINPDHWGIWLGLDWNHLIIGEGEPPTPIRAPIELHTTIDRFPFQGLPMVVGQLDWDQDGDHGTCRAVPRYKTE